MKKVLVFIDWYLPGFKAGGPIRSMANIAAHLANQYQFFIVTRNTDYLENIPYAGITPNKWVKSDNEHVIYLSENQISIKKIKQIIEETSFDLVYINGIYSFYFCILPMVLMRYFNNIKTIIAPRGMLSSQGLGVKSLKKRIFIALSKFLGLYKNIDFHVTSTEEKNDINRLKLKQSFLHLIPNLPPIISGIKTMKIEKHKGELKLVSIARISPEKNTMFALETLKKHQYSGKILFDLYGSIYNQGYWKQCMKCIGSLPENIEVRYKGELNNYLVIDKLQQYHFLFLPSKGENFGHSILESFLASRPVIISDKTPWKNLEGENVGWDINLEKTELFSEKIQFAIDLELEEYNEMVNSSLKYAVSKTQLDKIRLDYSKMFG